eukprot:g1564.t1
MMLSRQALLVPFAVYVATACGDPLSIPTVTLAGSDVQLPLLILGDGASWGRPSNYTLWYQLVGKGAGIDSAWDYGNPYGSPPTTRNGTENLIPPALAAAGAKREDVVITGKIPCSGFDGGLEPMTAQMVRAYIESNLAMLNTSYLDLLLLHHKCRTEDETAAVWHELEAAKRRGQARAIGVSNFVASDLQALQYHGNITEPIAANQCQFSVGKIDNATINWCKKHNVTLESYGSLHGPVPMNDPRIVQVATRHNTTAAAVTLKYVLQQGIALVTASDSHEYDLEDAALFDWELSAQDMADLDAAQGGRTDITCSDCYAQPCRTCQDAIKAAGCSDYIAKYDHDGCMDCVQNVNDTVALKKIKAVCSDDFIFKSCW